MRNRILSLCLALLMALSLLSGCGGPSAPVAEDEYTLPPEDGCNQLTLYWTDPDADYDKCDVWMWWDGQDGSGRLFHPCDYGVKCVVNVPESVTEVGFIVRRDCSDPGGSSWGEASKDYPDDRFAVITGPDTRIYLQPGDGGVQLGQKGIRVLRRGFALLDQNAVAQPAAQLVDAAVQIRPLLQRFCKFHFACLLLNRSEKGSPGGFPF